MGFKIQALDCALVMRTFRPSGIQRLSICIYNSPTMTLSSLKYGMLFNWDVLCQANQPTCSTKEIKLEEFILHENTLSLVACEKWLFLSEKIIGRLQDLSFFSSRGKGTCSSVEKGRDISRRQKFGRIGCGQTYPVLVV